MVTNWEEQQPIWYVSGVAAVAAGQEAHAQTEAAIVRFNRNGRTHRPGSGHARPNALGHANLRQLDQWGYVVVPDVGTLDAADELVRSVGELIPQYHGGLTHEVTYRPGNDHRAYSQSANTILAHTEAPGWHPSPAYLALFCHRQARCGGGHTDLLDMRRLAAALDYRRAGLDDRARAALPGTGRGHSQRDAEHRRRRRHGRPVQLQPADHIRLRPDSGSRCRLSAAAARRGRPQAGPSRQRAVPGAAHQCADPGRCAADLGQPAHAAREVGVRRSLSSPDPVLSPETGGGRDRRRPAH